MYVRRILIKKLISNLVKPEPDAKAVLPDVCAKISDDVDEEFPIKNIINRH